MFYNGYSGGPYSYMIDGDANADGLSLVGLGNDIMYVPKDSADITLAAPEQWPILDTLIRGQKCLSAQRGHIMRRNSCRGSWTTLLNARVSKVIGMGQGHSLELITDLFNALNFFDHDWGVQRVAASFLGDVTALESGRATTRRRRGGCTTSFRWTAGPATSRAPAGACSSGRVTRSDCVTEPSCRHGSFASHAR